MPTLNHTILSAHDADATARFLTEVLGLVRPPVLLGPFHVVFVDDHTSLDVMASEGPIHPQHYAFLVTEREFDEIIERLRERAIDFWADPGRSTRGEFNHWDDGRGAYFDDPNGHLLEIITRPYGTGGYEVANPHPIARE